MSKKKWQTMDVATGVKETGIRANLPSAPTASSYGGGSRFGNRGGDRRGGPRGGSRYGGESNSAADSADNWRRNGPPARPPARPRRDDGDRDRGDREMPRNRYPRRDDGGDRPSRFGGGGDRRRPDMDSAADAGNWRDAPRQPPRTRVGIDSSAGSSGRGWGSSSRPRDRDRDGFGESRRPSAFGSNRPSARSSTNSKFSGTKKGFGRKAAVDETPPAPRVTYSRPSQSRARPGGRFSSGGKDERSNNPPDEFPTLPTPPKNDATSTEAAPRSAKSSSKQNGDSDRQPAKGAPARGVSSKSKRKETPEQRAKKLQRSFITKIKQGKPVSLGELREGMKVQLKVNDNLIDSLARTVMSDKTPATLGSIAEALSNARDAETTSEIFVKLLGQLKVDLSATKMADILEESKVNFEDFVPEDEDVQSYYGDMMELVCFSASVNEKLASLALDSISLSDLMEFLSDVDGNDVSLPACRKIGEAFARSVLDDDDCLSRGNDVASAMIKICGGEMKKLLFITSVVEKWFQNNKPTGLDAKFQKLVNSEVIDFEDIRAWQQDQGDTNAAKRDALFAISDWVFTMDEAQTRAREDEENEENEGEDEEVAPDSYAGNLFEKPKHKTYSDIIYYA